MSFHSLSHASAALNPTQVEAVQHKEGPLLVLAGAGSGKTRIIVYRIAQLIASGVDPSQIVAVTFTNKAAEEMSDRIRQHLSLESYPLICTFHSLGVKILRASITHLGYEPHFIIYDEEDSNKIIKATLHALGIQQECKTFRSLISRAKEALIPPSDLDVSELPITQRRAVIEVYEAYQQRLREANALDFDDLLYLTVKLFDSCPEVLASYQKQWHYLLIDEYQDTNHAQYLIARYIVGAQRNLCVVGDPDQSIYSWRGANIQNILNFEKDYPGAKIIRLEQNYRSSSHILDGANALIQYNHSRYEKNLWSTRGEGEKILCFVGDNEYDEAHFVVREMERLRALRRIPLCDMTIFYRTNSQSRRFEDILLRERIPYVIVGGMSFYQRKEIKDLIAFLRMLITDHDAVAFERTLNLPKRGIGQITLEKIRSHAARAEVPLFAYCCHMVNEEPGVLRLSAKQLAALKDYVHLICTLRESYALQRADDANPTPHVSPNLLQEASCIEPLILETIAKTGYLSILREDKETFDDRKENLDELVVKAHEWELFNHSSDLAAFLEEIALKSSLDEAAFAEDRVNLMTLHNGKGLEFTAVFLVGMEEDLFPHAHARSTPGAIEEERRLCYVGMTRAKEYLYLSAAKTRFLWGESRMMRPSRFLTEIPKEHMTRLHR